MTSALGTPTNCVKKESGGFTLLEVLIALTIFAAIATVVSGTTSQSTDTALYLENRTLASWVAENRLAQIRLIPSGVSVGEANDNLDLGNREWKVHTKIISTEMAGVMRVTVSVSLTDDPDYTLTTLATVMGTH
ncbi:MAG: type II secretion system minor pseudopilin GspI [Oceanobacter sp.]